MIDHIVLLTDTKATTQLSLGPVAHVAQRSAARVTVAHFVRGSSELFYLEGQVRGLIDKQAIDQARPEVEALAEQLRAQGIETAVDIRVGSSFDEALSVAEELGADLLAVPTSSSREFTGRVIGSRTARILRDAKVPVLTVSERFAERAEGWKGFGKIVVPTALDADDGPILGAAERFAAEFGGRIEVVHVVEPIHQQVIDTPEGDVLLPKDTYYQIKTRLQARLSDAAHGVKLVPAAWRLIEDNKPGSGVMAYADQAGAEAIVVSSIERDAVRTTVMGSVVEHVVKHARVPVLTVRPHDFE